MLVFTRTQNAKFAESFADSILACAKDEGKQYGKHLAGLMLTKFAEDEAILPLLRDEYFSLAVRLLESVSSCAYLDHRQPPRCSTSTDYWPAATWTVSAP